MKKCCHTLTLTDAKGNVKWQMTNRKKKVCLSFIDEMLEKNWLQTEQNHQDSLMTLIQYLQAKPNWGWTLLRARLRGENK